MDKESELNEARKLYKKYLKRNPENQETVGCSVCGKSNVTLFKVSGQYACEPHARELNPALFQRNF